MYSISCLGPNHPRGSESSNSSSTSSLCSQDGDESEQEHQNEEEKFCATESIAEEHEHLEIIPLPVLR